MNQVVLVGRLTRDPEMRSTQTNNVLVASFSVAVNRRFTREGEPTADFFNCTAWAKTAEFVSKYFKKGMAIGIVGRLQNRTWEDQQGQKRYATDIIVENVEFVEKKGASSSSDGDFAAFGASEASGSDMGPAGDGDTSDFEVSSGDDLPF